MNAGRRAAGSQLFLAGGQARHHGVPFGFEATVTRARIRQRAAREIVTDEVAALGHYVLADIYNRHRPSAGPARELVGDEPFAVILGDDVIDAATPAKKKAVPVRSITWST